MENKLLEDYIFHCRMCGKEVLISGHPGFPIPNDISLCCKCKDEKRTKDLGPSWVTLGRNKKNDRRW